jgi:hypothetical protein
MSSIVNYLLYILVLLCTCGFFEEGKLKSLFYPFYNCNFQLLHIGVVDVKVDGVVDAKENGADVKAGGVVDAKADGVVDGVSIFFEIYG